MIIVITLLLIIVIELFEKMKQSVCQRQQNKHKHKGSHVFPDPIVPGHEGERELLRSLYTREKTAIGRAHELHVFLRGKSSYVYILTIIITK